MMWLSLLHAVATVTIFFLSPSTNSISGGSSEDGHCSGGRYNQEGPYHHLESNIFCAEHPRDGRSAIFSFPGMWRQLVTPTFSLISFTRLVTKTPQGPVPLIQARAVEESDQSVIEQSSMLIPMSAKTVRKRREPMTHATVSSRGMLAFPFGATRALE